jgi:pilus assembly protein Flp/PilA
MRAAVASNHADSGVPTGRSIGSVNGDRQCPVRDRRFTFFYESGVGKTMTKLLAASRRFVRDEEGASLAEYGLLLALIAAVCIGAITLLGAQIQAMFTALSGAI